MSGPQSCEDRAGYVGSPPGLASADLALDQGVRGHLPVTGVPLEGCKGPVLRRAPGLLTCSAATPCVLTQVMEPALCPHL